MSFSILTIGSELIKGKILDTNSQLIADKLYKNGLELAFQMTCPDKESDILKSLEFLTKNSDYIITTGGLGPTRDDITLEVISKFLNAKLVHSDEAWENCTNYFKKIGRKNRAASNKKIAYIPKGSQFIKNPYGTSGGVLSQFSFGLSPKSIMSFPGVPYELEYLLSIIDFSSYKDNSSGKMAQKVICFYDIGESYLQDILNSLESHLSRSFPNLEFFL